MTTTRLTATGPRGHQRLRLAHPATDAEGVIVRELGVMLAALGRDGGPSWATIAQAARTVERIAHDRSGSRAAEVTTVDGRLLPEFERAADALVSAWGQAQ